MGAHESMKELLLLPLNTLIKNESYFYNYKARKVQTHIDSLLGVCGQLGVGTPNSDATIALNRAKI